MTDPFRTLLLSLLLTSLLACRQERVPLQATGPGHQRKEHSAWFQNLPGTAGAAVGQSPGQGFPLQERHRGQTVYYLTSRCCYQPGQLYDSRGQLLREPDGASRAKATEGAPVFLETEPMKH